MRSYFLPLPHDLEPTGERCVIIMLPDDIDWISAFWGNFWSMARWYSWQRDSTESGAIAARRWREIWAEARAKFDAGECCEPEQIPHIPMEDYPLPICNDLRFDENGKLQGLCCYNPETCEYEWCDICGQEGGVTPSGGQPGPEDRPDYGQTKCWTFEMKGSDVRQLPIYVTDGDIITVTGATGGWTDGSITDWFCASGADYTLGACLGAGATDPSDPLPSVAHMRLVYNIGADVQDGYNTTYTVPVGTGPQNVVFQANDSSLSNNSGSINFKVCVQNGSVAPESTWCQEFDFTTGEHGWTPIFYAGFDLAIYSAGAGWGQNYPSSSPNINIKSPTAPAGTTYTRLSFTTAQDPADPSPVGDVENDTSTAVLGTAAGSGPNFDIVLGTPHTASRIGAEYQCGTLSCTTTTLITSVKLYGTGVNPFGSGNCS